jgi:hypothetical protein
MARIKSFTVNRDLVRTPDHFTRVVEMGEVRWAEFREHYRFIRCAGGEKEIFCRYERVA